MAVKDVKKYYHSQLIAYLSMKEDLAEFEEDFKNGYVTQQEVDDLREELYKVELNYHRLSYIMYLLNIPNRPSKKTKYHKQNETVLKAFKELNADEESVSIENEDSLKHFKANLKDLLKAKDLKTDKK